MSDDSNFLGSSIYSFIGWSQHPSSESPFFTKSSSKTRLVYALNPLIRTGFVDNFRKTADCS